MKKRKWLKSIALTIAATMCLSIPVFAEEPEARGNIQNTQIPEEFIGYASGLNTEWRWKLDDSFHYIQNTSGFDLRVVSKAHSDDSNQTRNGYALVPCGEYFIANFVHENSKINCYLYIRTSRYGTSGYASGWWSPDSVGSYPVAN